VSGNPAVSVVIPSYNHARFVVGAIASVQAQTYEDIELIVVDDGSTDSSVQAIERALQDSPLRRVDLRRHPNIGAALTIDRGIMASTGEYVAILNSDDEYAPERIDSLVRALVPGRDAFLFTGVTFEGVDGLAVDDYIWWYLAEVWLATMCPTVGYAMLAGSLTVSTSNFFFSRALFERLRGFNNDLLLSHDWDFSLRVLHYVEPVFVPESLMTYRLHRTNSTHSLNHRHLTEGMIGLERFLQLGASRPVNELAPTPDNWPVFFDYFCSNVRPWFSPEPLATHVTKLGFKTTPSAARRQQPIPGRDGAAIAALRDGLSRGGRASRADLPQLRKQIAQNWRTLAGEQSTSGATV
jgi:glycosyltransferase involved in cell wall biosynthesis